jgi:hypothetical protein
MQFRDLAVGGRFTFAAQVGFSAGRTFQRISSRRYIEVGEPGRVYTVGTTRAGVNPADAIRYGPSAD